MGDLKLIVRWQTGAPQGSGTLADEYRHKGKSGDPDLKLGIGGSACFKRGSRLGSRRASGPAAVQGPGGARRAVAIAETISLAPPPEQSDESTTAEQRRPRRLRK